MAWTDDERRILAATGKPIGPELSPEEYQKLLRENPMPEIGHRRPKLPGSNALAMSDCIKLRREGAE